MLAPAQHLAFIEIAASADLGTSWPLKRCFPKAFLIDHVVSWAMRLANFFRICNDPFVQCQRGEAQDVHRFRQ